MNETTILVWVNIAIFGIIAIIIVKLYFRKDELEKDETPLIPKDGINGLIQTGKDKIKNSQSTLSKTTPSKSSVSTYFSKQNQPKGASLRKEGQIPEDNFNNYIVPKTNEPNFSNKIESKKEEPTKPINFNYKTKVQKFQDPINETQIDIMSNSRKNTNPEEKKNTVSLEETPKHELKDLFSIDELIKKSKRKDNEREKESKTIKKEKEDTSKIKESIKQMKEGKTEEEPIVEINDSITETKPSSMTIDTKKEKNTSNQVNFYDIINNSPKDNNKDSKKIKDNVYNSEGITDAIKSSEKEDEKEPKSTINQKEIYCDDEEENISDILSSNKDEISETKEESIEEILTEDKTPKENVLVENEEIKTPSLKSPTKIESKEDDLNIITPVKEDYEFGAPLEDSELFKEKEEENILGDLDYRKDLAKITNTIKNSKIFNNVKEKLAPEHRIDEEEQVAEEMYLRNINTYKEETEFPEYEPIINESYENYHDDYDYEEQTQEELIRQENTRKVFDMVKNNETTPEPKTQSASSLKIKEKPKRNNIKITVNGEEINLRKGAEIIFKHKEETYSSKIYGIRGNDISVKYRGKKIIINPKDIKKVY